MVPSTLELAIMLLKLFIIKDFFLSNSYKLLILHALSDLKGIFVDIAPFGPSLQPTLVFLTCSSRVKIIIDHFRHEEKRSPLLKIILKRNGQRSMQIFIQ